MSDRQKITVAVKKLAHGKGLDLPAYATQGSAGVDLVAAISTDVCIKPRRWVCIPTGLVFEIPVGYEIQTRPRSGLALRDGISLLNSPGTIDSDYRGEVGIILINYNQEDFIVTRGMRIAQAVMAPVVQIQWQEVSSLQETARGTKGFGSTGIL